MRKEWAENAPVDLSAPEAEFELHLGQLGSGSDYTVFLDHLGVPSISFGFRGKYGVYHSIYDNFRWMERFGDPGFAYHVAAARFYGLVAMRLAAADVLPLRYGSYAGAMQEQLDQLSRDVVRKRRMADQIEAGSVLNGDLSPVLEALDELRVIGERFDRFVDQVISRGDTGAAEVINSSLLPVERALLSEDGLPDRPWFRNLVYAPGLTTGYAPWPFPELRQALEDDDLSLFERGAERVGTALGEMSSRLVEGMTAAGFTE